MFLMKKTIILLSCIIVAIASCNPAEDTRYFAPEVEFTAATVPVSSDAGTVNLVLTLSRAVQDAIQINLNVTSPLEQGVQYNISASTVVIPAGETQAVVQVTLADDEIWTEESWIEMAIVPGELYTVDPEGNCICRIEVGKIINLPFLKIIAPESEITTNPYLAETLHFVLESNRAVGSDTPVTLSFDSAELPAVVLPAGATQVAFDLDIPNRDICGLDRITTLSIVTNKGVYVPDPQLGALDIRLYDPVPDFSRFLKTQASNNGEGYVIRQAILGPDGVWNGNQTVDLGPVSDGSGYLRNFKNMAIHASFNCMCNTSVSQLFRFPDLCPNLTYPSPVAILDYGNDQNHREFFPADSVMRFVPDKGETEKGSIYLEKPRTFVARYGSYAEWQAGTSNYDRAWILDSRATGGDLAASTHPAFTGQISVTLQRLEGRFDFTNADAPVLITAWFSCDHEMFMKDIDNTLYDVIQEDGLWKVKYKLWPR